MEKRFFIHDYHEQAILILPSNLKGEKKHRDFANCQIKLRGNNKFSRNSYK